MTIRGNNKNVLSKQPKKRCTLDDSTARREYAKGVIDFIHPATGLGSKWSLDTALHSRTHYVFFTVHDIQFFLGEKFREKINTFAWTWDNFQDQLMRQSFVKRRYTQHGTTYALTAPKKRMDRWFLKNINRFN